MPEIPFLHVPAHRPRSKVLALGLAGLEGLVPSLPEGLPLIAVDSNPEGLARVQAHVKILRKPSDRRSFQANREEIQANLPGADLVLFFAEVGDAAKSRAVPLLGRCAREVGASPAAIVLTPPRGSESAFDELRAMLRDAREVRLAMGEGSGKAAILDALRDALGGSEQEFSQGELSRILVSAATDWDRVELSAVAAAMGYLQEHYPSSAGIQLWPVEAPEMQDRAFVTVLVMVRD